MSFELPTLPYAHDALEPAIDTLTMQIHHGKHHAAYVTNLNAALEKHPELANKSLESLVTNLNEVPEDIRMAGRNNGGGHFNHSLFWQLMSPNGGGDPKGDLAKALAAAFGSFEAFKDTFSKAAVGRFGSGWAWLGLQGGALTVLSMPNQDLRPEYISNWWKVVDWEEVAQRYAAAR